MSAPPSWTLQDSAPAARICAAGDLGFAGALHGLVGAGVLDAIAPAVRGSDLAFVNLETPIVAGSTPEDLFAAPDGTAEAVAAAGFDLVHLANNHVLDHGTVHLRATREALAAAGLGVLGAGPDPEAARCVVRRTVNGVTIGWLAAGRTLQPQEDAGDVFWEYDFDAMRRAVRDARGEVDVLFVSLHMGYLFVDVPHPEQRRDALALAAAGADVVLMHHAHVLQGVEVAPGVENRKSIICYNLGNLLLDWRHGASVVEQMVEEQRTGALFLFDVDDNGVCRLTLQPFRVEDDWNVRPADGDVGRRILDRVARLSASWDDAEAVFHRQMSERVTVLQARSSLEELRRGGVPAFFRLLRRLRWHHVRMVTGWLLRRLRW